MKEVVIVAIWDRDNKVFTRSVLVNNRTKELKMNGRKPNKAIVPESCTDKKILKKIKKICSYDCKIVTAKNR